MLNYTINQLNSPFDDSVFFLRNVHKRRAFMFDCGKLGGLRHSDILSLEEIFISHTHMDHFIGFDRVMRSSLMGTHQLTVFGPPGFIYNIDGKFRSYTWNLIDEYKFSVRAIELSPTGDHKQALFLPKNNFIPEISSIVEDQLSIGKIGDNFILKYEFFDHRTISMGYRVDEPLFYSVDKDALNIGRYKPNTWLSVLKKAILNNELGTEIKCDTLDGEVIKTAEELKTELISIRPSQSVTYITDCSPSQTNIDKAIEFAKDSTLLIIEASFLDDDMDHAIAKNHLTLNIAKHIYNKSNAEYVRFTHFASRYEMMKSEFFTEVYKGMNGKIYSSKNSRENLTNNSENVL